VCFEISPAGFERQIVIAKNESLRTTDAKRIPRIENLEEVVDYVFIRPAVLEANFHSNFRFRVGTDSEVNKTCSAVIRQRLLGDSSRSHCGTSRNGKPGGFLESWPFGMEQQRVMRR